MKLPALTREQVRHVDQVAIEEYAMPGVVLMENAGRGAAELINQLAPEGQITILCGSGNNAGDGYVIARYLQLLGRHATIVSLIAPEDLRGDALINARIAKHAEIEIQVVTGRASIAQSITGAVIVDALLGTGATGNLRPLYAQCVAAANAYKPEFEVTRIAIDVPTGLDCNTGHAADPTFIADHTLTFVARKVGFEKDNADAYVGVVHEIGIGVPQKLLDRLVHRQT
jgi:NAD(P)H-hydrate epimerase